MTMTDSASPAYWSRDHGDGERPLLKRTCPWGESVPWRTQYLLVQSFLEELRSPLLVVPENGIHLLRGSFIIPEGGWLSVPAEAFCARWTIPQIDRIMLDVARAVELLNSANILVLNLCPPSVLIDDSEAEPRAALSDLSSSLSLSLPETMRSAFLNMPEYAAPEVRASEAEDAPLTPDFSADVFSLGMLYHVYLTGQLPYFDEALASDGKTLIPTGKARLSRKLDQPHRKLIERLLEITPARRMTSVSAAVRAIDLTLRSGNCLVELNWPGHEGETLTLSAPNTFNSRRRIPPSGTVVFGPLLSSLSYSLSCEGKILASVSFPFPRSGQRLSLSVPALLAPEPELPNAAQSLRVIELDPPVNHIHRVEVLSERYCMLTLINGGTLRVRTMDAARFGIEEILNSKDR